MGRSFKAFKVRCQDLSSPDGPVTAVAGAVEGDPYDPARMIVLCQAGSDVGVVVLDLQDRKAVLPGQERGIVAGMEVADHKLRFCLQQGLHPAHCFPEGGCGPQVLQVSDIGGGIKEAVRPYAEGVLELSSHGQDRPFHLLRHHVGEGGIASGPADHVGSVPVKVHDRIVAPDPDHPVMGEDAVAQMPQLP